MRLGPNNKIFQESANKKMEKLETFSQSSRLTLLDNPPKYKLKIKIRQNALEVRYIF